MRKVGRVSLGSGVLSLMLLSACGDDSGSDASAISQTPPQGAALLEPWLATGDYKKWHCEAAPHASRNPSPHSFNRICSNDLIHDHATGTAAWPKGAAAVKELYADLTSTTPVGYAVYYKTADDSAAGANWYWYERVPLSFAAAPHDPVTGVVADGMGGSGSANAICVSCHVAAGSDAAHTPSAGGRDQVYTPM